MSQKKHAYLDKGMRDIDKKYIYAHIYAFLEWNSINLKQNCIGFIQVFTWHLNFRHLLS